MKKWIALLLAALLMAACSSPKTKEEKGTWVGAGAGAAGGALVGQAIGGNTGGTLIGAGVGAVAGGAIGKHYGKKKDREEAAMRQETSSSQSARVQRNANVLTVTLKSEALFPVGSSDLTPGAADEIDRVSRVLKQYPNSNVLVAAHTDSSGSDLDNLDLSKRRADSVRGVLVSQGVSRTRIRTIGFGAGSPIADNGTEAGRQQNRRIVITIRPQS